MKNFGEILDVVSLILTIVCLVLAIFSENWTAVCGWGICIAWIIRCKKSELRIN